MAHGSDGELATSCLQSCCHLTLGLYKELSTLLSNDELIKQYSAKARRYIECDHSNDVVVKMVKEKIMVKDLRT